ncbi:MAG: type II restriction endonuclease [Candidatus Paceibacterota bacterium]
MADLKEYKAALGLSSLDDIIAEFLRTLLETNRTYDFFVDWRKVKENNQKLKVEIGILSSLAGSKNIKNDFKALLQKYPEVLKVLPLLIAERNSQIMIVDGTGSSPKTLLYEFPTKHTAITLTEIDRIIRFCELTGILNMLTGLTTLRDYLFGTEVGMDTNARKNRSGTAMESLMGPVLANVAKANPGLEVFSQTTFGFVEAKRGLRVPAVLRNRKTDFIVTKGNKLVNVEVNFFAGSGSKPQEIVDSYINRHNELAAAGCGFIWVTDGPGWKKQKNQIRIGFNKVDYLMNLKMAKQGLLEAVLNKED